MEDGLTPRKRSVRAMNRLHRLVALLACCLRLSDTNASAQGVRGAPGEAPKATISRAASTISVDGVLDEPD
jgi:hypothetical protein